MSTSVPVEGVIKHGIGYDLVVVKERGRLVLGIQCHTCRRVSYYFKDIAERYCGACHVFHEDTLGSQQA
jgi:hypothetical protein